MEDGLFQWSECMVQFPWSNFLQPNVDQELGVNLTRGKLATLQYPSLVYTYTRCKPKNECFEFF